MRRRRRGGSGLAPAREERCRSWLSTSVSASSHGTARSARSSSLVGGRCGAFWNFYARDAQASIDGAAGAAREAAPGNRSWSDDGEAAARVPQRSRRARITDSIGCAPCSPRSRTSPICCAVCRAMATQSNLSILGFTPHATAKKAAARGVADRVEARRNYHDSGLFLERVSKFPRIINVGDIKMKARNKQNDAARRSPPKCTATTFVLLDPKEVPAARRPTPEAGAAPAPKRDGVRHACDTVTYAHRLTLIAALAHAQAAPPAPAPAAATRLRLRAPAAPAAEARDGETTSRGGAAEPPGFYLQPRRPARSVRQLAASAELDNTRGRPRAGLGGLALARSTCAACSRAKAASWASFRAPTEDLHRAGGRQAVRRHDSLDLPGRW